jgi:NADPH-dependent 2,4-dienoyl-CoA reductase/sulfur reductase-like enzyme
MERQLRFPRERLPWSRLRWLGPSAAGQCWENGAVHFVGWAFVLNAAPRLMESSTAVAAKSCAIRAWTYAPMDSKRSDQFDVLVVGGGPAGLAAAASAADCGVRVAIIDDNPALGGQIWRGQSGHETTEARMWSERLYRSGAKVICGARIFHQPEPGILHAERADDLFELRYRHLVLATGARERFLPFPGWTLPNVMGAGGLQALVKCGLPISDKRVVVAGSGPLLLAVAAYLIERGAKVLAVCEQASRRALFSFGLALLRYPDKLKHGLRLRKQLRGVPFLANSWPMAARGKQFLEEVVISTNGIRQAIPCDYLACGFHLVPNLELAALLGCQMQGGFVKVDELQRTSVPKVFCAGETTGIGGLELSQLEGEIAGLAAAGRQPAGPLLQSRRKLNKFVEALDQTFGPRHKLRKLPEADTIVCRCEDVTQARLARHSSWRAAKLQTRCGMGPCQGRICGPAAEFLFQWSADSVRPPIFPTRVENLTVSTVKAEAEHRETAGGRG